MMINNILSQNQIDFFNQNGYILVENSLTLNGVCKGFVEALLVKIKVLMTNN